MLVSSFIHERTLKNVLLFKVTVLRETHINIESKSRVLQFSYIDVMDNMKLLAVVTPTSISHNMDASYTTTEDFIRHTGGMMMIRYSEVNSFLQKK